MVYNESIYIENITHTMMLVINDNDRYHFYKKFSMLKRRLFF